MTADRLPAVIAAMVEVATHGTRGAADTLAPDHDLAAALSGAVDIAEIAPLLPLSGADHQHAAGLLRIVIGAAQPAEPLADADRVLACRVAARLASSAALLVALDAHAFAGMAGMLWRAAGRLCSLETAPGMTDLMVSPEAIDEVLAGASQRVAVDIMARDPYDLYPDSPWRTGVADLEAVIEAAEAAAATACERHGIQRDTIDGVIEGLSDALDKARATVDLSAHLAAADKRARDASAEVLRLHGELGKARKEAATAARDRGDLLEALGALDLCAGIETIRKMRDDVAAAEQRARTYAAQASRREGVDNT